MSKMLIFGLGYSAGYIAASLRIAGWRVVGTSRAGRAGTIAFDDDVAVAAALAAASHILVSIPPEDLGDPVLARYGDLLGARWLGYLSSTGVYGDAQGAWVDETSPTGTGRRSARAIADATWLVRSARVFRLPGIYGPGRSALDRVRDGTARRMATPGQVFSRIHVDDLADGLAAALAQPDRTGVFNLCDDEPAPAADVTLEACRLLGVQPPPQTPLDLDALTPAARRFWAESKRVSNARAKAALGWCPDHPTYREGLAAILATGG